MVKLYNTLSRSIEEFNPLNPPHVGMYTCGPTVYDYQHIGHMRRYVGDDILIRVLKLNGYEVKHVMNITDVGHLVSDADEGEDKMEKGARKFGMSVWDIAKKFEKQFFDSAELLDIQKPDELMHATDYISDQIDLIEILTEKRYTYRTSDGIYFDTSKFKDYGKLSGNKPKKLKAGARVEMGEKKNPTDFALWKFSNPQVPSYSTSQVDKEQLRRQMEWYFEGPLRGKLVNLKNWHEVPEEALETIGFPGWHLECSAMSMRALGPTFDIHTGGIDHISIHHTNEIAQSEAATGRDFVKYWVHHNFLLVDGQKMSKSLENTYTVADVVHKKYDPLALRYLYFQTHYRQEMNFTWESLEAAAHALNNLREEIASWDEPKIGCAGLEQEFLEAVNNDLNMPEALAIVWKLVRSKYPSSAKAKSLLWMDKVLGLNLKQAQRQERKAKNVNIPDSVMKLVEEREALRKEKRYHLADELRHKLRKMGYDVLDEKGKSMVHKIPPGE